MAIPFEIMLDDTGDLDPNGGLSNAPITVARAIEQSIGLFLGSWILDTSRGLDWFRFFETKLSDADLELEAERIREIVRRVAGVRDVIEVSTSRNVETGLIRWGVVALLDDAASSTVVVGDDLSIIETNWHPGAFVIDLNSRPSFAGR